MQKTGGPGTEAEAAFAYCSSSELCLMILSMAMIVPPWSLVILEIASAPARGVGHGLRGLSTRC